MTTVLVTGATGFVGSHALERLAGSVGVRLIAACRNPNGLGSFGRMEVRKGDLRDADYLATLCRDVDVVVHAAAWTSLFGKARQSRELFLEPSLALIDAAQASGVKRFVFTSSNAAAAPAQSSDARNAGIRRAFWPHLSNVVRIENRLRAAASAFETVVNLRLALFVGRRFALGLLPILLPRLKTHLVPWVGAGKTDLALVDGRDIGQAVECAVAAPLAGFQSFNILGPETPTVREVIGHLHEQHGYPEPHFGVPFWLAYPFAWMMEAIDPLVPWDPLVTRSIIHLLEETGTNNEEARAKLGYDPQYPWRASVDEQLREMAERPGPAMRMYVPTN